MKEREREGKSKREVQCNFRHIVLLFSVRISRLQTLSHLEYLASPLEAEEEETFFLFH